MAAAVIYKLAIDCFIDTPAFQAVLEKAGADRLLARSQMTIKPGGIEAAVAQYGDATTPALVIVEAAGEEEALLGGLARLAEVCAPTTKVVVASALNDVRVYRALLHDGVSEYVVLPATPAHILDAIAAIFHDPAAPPRGKLIACFGARGGAGSSTVAHNVAWSLTRIFEDEAAIIDFDLMFGTAAMAFNATLSQTVSDALAQPERLDPSLLERFMIRHDERLLILASPALLRGSMALDGAVVEKVVEMVRLMASFVVLDLPRTWLPWVEQTLATADHLIVTATPDLAGLRDAKNLLDVFGQKSDGNGFHYVLNRSGAFAKGELSPKDFAETLGKEPALTLPWDPGLFLGAFNNGQAVGEQPKGDKVAESFRRLAVKVSGRSPPAARAGKKVDFKTMLRGLTKGKK